MRLAVIGTGYVGLVAGAGFADFGNEVTCVDSDAAKIAMLESGDLPIHEPGLDQLVARNAERGNLRFSTDLPGAVAGAEIVFIAVGTPASGSGAAERSCAAISHAKTSAWSCCMMTERQMSRRRACRSDAPFPSGTNGIAPHGTSSTRHSWCLARW